MASCLIVPIEMEYGILRMLWRRHKERGSLIDLDLARVYFKTPQVWIDNRKPEQPIIIDRDPS